LLEMLTGVEKFAPPSVDFAMKTSRLPSVSSYHEAITVVPDIATEGLYDPPALFERLTEGEKVTPPSIDLAMKMSKLPCASSYHAVITVSPEIATEGS